MSPERFVKEVSERTQRLIRAFWVFGYTAVVEFLDGESSPEDRPRVINSILAARVGGRKSIFLPIGNSQSGCCAGASRSLYLS